MADGQDSTLILETLDDALSNITFDCGAGTGASSGYVPDLGSLRLNEERRLEIAYSQGAMMDGGMVTNYHGPLVPVTFDVVVSDSTRAAMMQKAEALFNVVTSDEGGYLRYKPDGVGAGVMETYYHFVKSPPPALKQQAGNRWDRAARDNGAYRIVLKVTLMTQPFATSNPASLTSLVSADEKTNIDDGTDDYFTISAASIKGSLPALCRVTVANQVAGAAAAIGRFWLSRRTRTLTNFASTYNTAVAQAPTGAWSTVVDASRCDGGYYRCTPVASEQVYAIRFTISNWDSHIGRAALLLVCRCNTTQNINFDVYYRWTLANYATYGEAKNVTEVLKWTAIILGEPDLPDTEMSDTEELDLYLDVCVVRKAGSGTFEIDALKLMYTDECALQLDAPSRYGAQSTHTLLAENLDEEIAHIYTTASSKLAYLCSAFGNFLTLLPDRDNRIDVAWLRAAETLLVEDFAGYGNYWMKVADFESDEDWYASAYVDNKASPHAVEGADYWGLVWISNNNAYITGSWSFTRFAGTDYLTGFVWAETSDWDVRIWFETSAGNRFEYEFTASAGDNFVKVKKEDLTKTGSPSWANITKIWCGSEVWGAGTVFDDFRFVLADPDDAAEFNDTGDVWDFPSGTWHIYELDGATKSLGCYAEAGETVALLHENYGADVMISARVRVCRADGEAGLVFRVSDGTSGSEDMYGFFIDTANNQVELREWTAGSPANIESAVAYTCTYDIDYYMGVIVQGTTIRCYISTDESTLWDSDNKVFDTTDDTIASGQVGFIVVGDNIGRFGDFELRSAGDQHDPSDTADISIDAMFRTIFPFSE